MGGVLALKKVGDLAQRCYISRADTCLKPLTRNHETGNNHGLEPAVRKSKEIAAPRCPLAAATRHRLSEPMFHHVLDVPVSARDHSQGPDSAPITVVMYGDYQCPFTAQLHLVITRLQRRFDGRLRYVFRHFPLFAKHPFGQLAAEVAEAAGAQGRYWEMHAYLFQRQNDFNRDCLAAGAGLLGLDYVRLDREISDHIHLERVQADAAGGKRSGVASTPTLFINGIMYDGSEDFETLSRYIEALPPLK